MSYIMKRTALSPLFSLVVCAAVSCAGAFAADAPPSASPAASAKPASPKSPVAAVSSPASRSVVRGDTLWGITKNSYGDPFLWPNLWEVNKSTVSNPHLIYPGQILVLPAKDELKKIKLSEQIAAAVAALTAKETQPPVPPVKKKSAVDRTASAPAPVAPVAVQDEPSPSASAGVPPIPAVAADESSSVEAAAVSPQVSEASTPVVSEPEPAAEPISSAPAVPETVSAPPPAGAPASARFKSEGRVVDTSFTPDGIVVGTKEQKLLISQGDIVYIDLPFIKASVGDRFGIYRKTGKMRHPSDGRVLGNELVRIGTVEIIGSSSGAASAKILSSSDPVEIKDWIIAEK